MHGQEFQADFLVLPLEGCQMVMGIQWLILLGPILWDFKQLRMEFAMDGKRIILQRSSTHRLQLMQVKSLAKAL